MLVVENALVFGQDRCIFFSRGSYNNLVGRIVVEGLGKELKKAFRTSPLIQESRSTGGFVSRREALRARE